MNLSPKKCKEMLISFLRMEPEVTLLVVNNTPLEKVKSHKVSFSNDANLVHKLNFQGKLENLEKSLTAGEEES